MTGIRRWKHSGKMSAKGGTYTIACQMSFEAEASQVCPLGNHVEDIQREIQRSDSFCDFHPSCDDLN